MTAETSRLAAALGCLIESATNPGDGSHLLLDVESAREVLAAHDALPGPMACAVDVLAVLQFHASCQKNPMLSYGKFCAEDDIEQARAAVAELIEALSFYTSICGNTCAMVTRETAAEMYAKGTAALANVDHWSRNHDR